MKRFVACLAFSAVAAGCDPSPQSARLTVTMDTIAGVVHVGNPAALVHDTALVLVSIGRTGAGGTPSPDEFGRIHSLALDAAGNLLVADGQAREVRVFSADGQFLRRFGRPGAGPGEFPSLYSLGWIGDTLLTLELARVSAFEPDGRFREHYPWLPFTGPPDVVRFYTTGPDEVYVLGRLPAGVQGRSFIRFNAEGPQDTLRLVASDSDPVSALLCPHSSGILSIFSIPFASRRIAVPAPEGRAIVAYSADYRITVVSSEGDTLRVIEREYSPLPISDTEWAEATQEYSEFRESNPGVQCDPASMPRADRKAAIQEVFFGYEGQMIVEVTTEDATRYDFFDADGVAYATVLAPRRDPSVVPVFREDRLAQVVSDDLGVQHVQVLRIPRDSRPRRAPGA